MNIQNSNLKKHTDSLVILYMSVGEYCEVKHLQRRLPPRLHVQMSSLYTNVFGKMKALGQVLLQIRSHWLIRIATLKSEK